jgi:hypothetical protein
MQYENYTNPAINNEFKIVVDINKKLMLVVVVVVVVVVVGSNLNSTLGAL